MRVKSWNDIHSPILPCVGHALNDAHFKIHKKFQFLPSTNKFVAFFLVAYKDIAKGNNLRGL